MEQYKLYDIFAKLLGYPGEDYPEVALECFENLSENYLEAAEEIKPFVDFMCSTDQDRREELYTKTFDVQPICYLDLGYVIFGEDYKRGAFLLHMQEEQRKAGNDCGTDLSDNICNMLTLYSKCKDQEILNELAIKIMIPGLEKMISEFNQARVDLKVKVLKKMHRAIIQEELNSGNVYKNVFGAMLIVFKKDFQNINYDGVLDPIVDLQHHKTFFGKQSVNIAVNQMARNEVKNLVNNYNLD